MEGFGFLSYNLHRLGLTVHEDPIHGLRVLDSSLGHSFSGAIWDGHISFDALAYKPDLFDAFGANIIHLDELELYRNAVPYGRNSIAFLSGTIAGAGHVPGALELVYHGAIINPKIRLTGNLSGRTYGVCSVSATLAATDTLKFSTRYEDSYAKKIAAGGTETDLLDSLDLSSTPFFHIPVNEPCTISVEADAAFTGSADLLIYYYYRSV